MLGKAQTATNKFQLPKKNLPWVNLKSRGMIAHAITIEMDSNVYYFKEIITNKRFLQGNIMIPKVQKSSIQHRIFSRYFVG